MFDWIVNLLADWGAGGLFLLMLLENVFPPIPSEVVLPLAGYTAYQGRVSLSLTILAGTAGSVAGATIWYSAGRWLGTPRLKRFAARHGRWLTLTPTQIDHVDRWFARHGRWAVLFGRMAPGIRTLISVPAGVTAMPLAPFIVYTTAGSALWTTLLVAAGYELGEKYAVVGRVIEPASNLILVAAALWYGVRVLRFRHSG